MTYLVQGMIYRRDGEMVPDTIRIIKIHRDLDGDTRGLWSFCPVGLYSHRVGRPLIDGEIGIIGNCLIAISDDAGAVRDLHRVKDTVFHRCPAPTLANGLAEAF